MKNDKVNEPIDFSNDDEILEIIEESVEEIIPKESEDK